MFKNIEFLINGEQADFSSTNDFNFKIVKEYYDITNFENAKGSYTLGLKLPRTIKNESIFRYVSQDIEQGFNILRKYDAIVRCDGIQILKGLLTLTSIKKNEYEVNIVGDNISWVDGIRGKTLQDLTQFRKFRYSGTKGVSTADQWINQQPNTISMWDVWQTQDGGDYDIQFPLVSYGNFPSDGTNPAVIETNRAVNNYYALDNRDVYAFDWSELYPTVYERAIVRAIFAESGYSVNGNYFTLPESENNLVAYTSPDNADARWNWGIIGILDIEWDFIPIQIFTTSTSDLDLNDSLRYYNNGLDDVFYIRPFASPLLLDSETINQNYGYSTVWNPLYPVPNQYYKSYIVPADGRYRVRYTADVTVINSVILPIPGYTANVSSMVVVRDTPDFLGASGDGLWRDSVIPKVGAANEYDSQVKDYDFRNMNTNNYYSISFDVIVDAKAGNTIDIIYAINDLPITNEAGVSFDGDVPVTLVIEPLFDYELDPAWNLPPIQATDFMKTILKKYNLFLNVDDKQNKISLNSFNNFFEPQVTALDISKQIETDSIEVKPVNSFKQFDFKLTKDEEDISTFDLENVLMQNANFTFINNSLYFTQTKLIDLLYSPTSMKNYLFAGTVNTTLIDIPTLSNQEVANATLLELNDGDVVRPLAYNLRMLKWGGLLNTGNSNLGFWVGSLADTNNTRFTLAGPNQAGNLVYPYCFYDLTFNFPYLYSTFYEKYIVELSRSVNLNALFFIDTALFNSIRPNRLIKIGKDLYYLNKIDGYSPVKDDLTKINLIKKT